MNIGDEVQLRSNLVAELDLLDPGPLPLDTVVRQGRAVMIRRRALAAAAVVFVAAAAVAVPKLIHIASQPASPLPYHVTVSPPGNGASRHLIASGRVSYSGNNMRWSVSGFGTGPRFHLYWSQDVWRIYHNGQLISLEGGGSAPDPNVGVPRFPRTPVALLYPDAGGEPTKLVLTFRADVRYVLVSLTNGQVLMLRPVAILGPAQPAFAAAVLPFETAVGEISAYSGSGEVGYTVPFGTLPGTLSWLDNNPQGDFQILRWLKPDQPATPESATYTIGRGTVHGEVWSEQLKVGPWGTCVISPLGPLIYYDCHPAFGGELTGTHVVRSLATVLRSQDHIGWEAIVARPEVSYVLARLPHGRLVQVRLYPVDGAKFATIAWTGGSAPAGWLAYAASGQLLASGTFP